MMNSFLQHAESLLNPGEEGVAETLGIAFSPDINSGRIDTITMLL